MELWKANVANLSGENNIKAGVALSQDDDLLGSWTLYTNLEEERNKSLKILEHQDQPLHRLLAEVDPPNISGSHTISSTDLL